MPRQTNKTYLAIAHELAARWQTDPDSFADYSLQDQRYLHDYYRPSEVLSDKQLLEHRQTISKTRPSLPQCAGRALKHLYVPAPVVFQKGKGVRALSVRAVLRPEPDYSQFARALLDLSWQMSKPADFLSDELPSSF